MPRRRCRRRRCGSAAAVCSRRATIAPTGPNGALPTPSARGSKKSMNAESDAAAPGRITVAAMGDLHVTEASEHRYRDVFAEISDVADVLVLCGDLTNFGKPREAEILAEDLRNCTIPSVGVLGNHDFECGAQDDVAKILHSAGLNVLGEQAVISQDVGFAGVKGFVGGFGRGELGAFGEPEIKAFVVAALEEARKLA